MYVSVSELRNFWYFYCYFFRYFVGTSDALSVQITCLSANMYRQISQYTDKFPNVPTKVRKDIMPPPPPLWQSGYASISINACHQLNLQNFPDNVSKFQII